MTYDIIVEGVSLIRNYMEQFRSILRDEKYSGLIDRLENKVLELEKENNQREATAGKNIPATVAG
jgi:phospholipid transport system substrate-binding protein